MKTNYYILWDGRGIDDDGEWVDGIPRLFTSKSPISKKTWNDAKQAYNEFWNLKFEELRIKAAAAIVGIYPSKHEAILKRVKKQFGPLPDKIEFMVKTLKLKEIKYNDF